MNKYVRVWCVSAVLAVAVGLLMGTAVWIGFAQLLVLLDAVAAGSIDWPRFLAPFAVGIVCLIVAVPLSLLSRNGFTYADHLSREAEVNDRDA